MKKNLMKSSVNMVTLYWVTVSVVNFNSVWNFTYSNSHKLKNSNQSAATLPTPGMQASQGISIEFISI